ncbi:MAG: serine/threonine protein kinase [Gemmatimonadota bacterium]|nr:serine/threonine protein kinase [Gemmatimonadota bacterium]
MAHTTIVAARYRIDREIGRGGMATVYLAHDLRHDRQVALKFIHAEVADREATERFRSEIALLASLQHPHILPLYDSGEFDGALFYVMPFIAGESLRGRLDREKQLPVDDAIRIAREVADALAHAHAQDVIHRDVKPENILISQGHALVGDFGIARAVKRAGARRLTDAGFAIGTLAYMSPEQASGDPVDGRSDLYSLGCVTYEMLTGHVPFDGATNMARLAKRHSASVVPLRQLRPAVPISVDDAVLRALAAEPGDRFQSVADFSAALVNAPPPVANLLTRLLGSSRAKWAALAIGLAASAALPFVLRPGPLDPQTYVVLPFVHRGGAAPALFDGDNCQQLLYQAFGRWDGITLVDDMRAHDVRDRAGSGPLSLDAALRAARSLHAGRLAWGEVWMDHGNVVVRGIIYDVRTQEVIRQHAVTLRADLADAELRFEELTDTLLIPVLTASHTRLPSSSDGVRGTRSLAALSAYFRAHEALAAWQLDSAETLFQSSVALDPEYPHANYWLAQVMEWRGDDAAQWLASARKATVLSSRLSATDSALATALFALAEGRFVDACASYQRLAGSRDSLSFAVWYGLGDCRARDTVVVPWSSSASGWRFRSGYASAIQAYVKALALIPSAYKAFAGTGLERLESLLFTEITLRRGATSSDTAMWVAYPSLSHDTLAFVPYRYVDIATGRAPRPVSSARAIAHNREQLQGIVASWVREYPNSPLAYEALARVLEIQGRINHAGGPDASALSATGRALELATDAAVRRRLGLLRTRLLLVSADFTGARALADSMLGAARGANPAEADELKPLAALTGRVQRTVDLLVTAAPEAHFLTTTGRLLQPPLPVAEASRALLGYVSLGSPVDSILSTTQRLERALGSYVSVGDRAAMRDGVENFALQQSYPVVPNLSIQRDGGPGDYLLDIQRAASRADAPTVRMLLNRTSPSRKLDRPGDLAIYLTYQEAWLLVHTGDSAAAIRLLDASLTALPALGPHLLDFVPNAAFLVRVMALRSDLAAGVGDRVTARKWGAAVTALWSDADPTLQPVVARMRARQ